MKPALLWKLDRHTSEVVRGASVALILRVLGAALTLLFNLLIARMFGAAGSGAYFLAFTAMTIATVFGRMGMDNSLLRFIAGHASAAEWSEVKGVYRIAIHLAIAASATTTLAMVLGARTLAERLFHEPALTTVLRWMALAVLPVVVATLFSQMLRALKRVWASMLTAVVWTPGLALVMLLLVGAGRGPLGAVWAYAGAAALTALGAWWWWHHLTPELRGVTGSFDTGTLLRSSVPLLWIASMSMAMNWIATFALGAWGTIGDVGLFNAASRVSFLVSFVLVAVDNISAPKFAELYLAGDREALARTARNTVRLMLLLAAPLLLLIFAAPRQIMGLFGTEFQRGATVLVILALAQAANVIAGSVGYLLMMSGHEVQVRNSNMLAAVTCLVGAVVLVPRYAALGAAMSVAVALLARNFYEIMMVRRYLGIGFLLFARSDR